MRANRLSRSQKKAGELDAIRWFGAGHVSAAEIKQMMKSLSLVEILVEIVRLKNEQRIA